MSDNIIQTIEAHLLETSIESCKRHPAQDLVDEHFSTEMIVTALYESSPNFLAGWINLFSHSTASMGDCTKLGIIAAGLGSRKDVTAREAAVDAAERWGLLCSVKRHIDNESEQWLKDYIRKVLDENN